MMEHAAIPLDLPCISPISPVQVGKQMMEHAALFPEGEHPMPEGAPYICPISPPYLP